MQYLCLVILWTICGLSNLQAQTVHLEPEKPRAFRFYGDLLYGYTLYTLHARTSGLSPVQQHTGQEYGSRLRFQYSLPFYQAIYLGTELNYRFRMVDLWVNKPVSQGLGKERILEHRAHYISLGLNVGYRHSISQNWIWQTELGLALEGSSRAKNWMGKRFFDSGVLPYYPTSLAFSSDVQTSPNNYVNMATYFFSHRRESGYIGAWTIGTGVEYLLPKTSKRLYLGLAYRLHSNTKAEYYFIGQDRPQYPKSGHYLYTGPLSTLFLHLGIGF